MTKLLFYIFMPIGLVVAFIVAVCLPTPKIESKCQ